MNRPLADVQADLQGLTFLTRCGLASLTQFAARKSLRVDRTIKIPERTNQSFKAEGDQQSPESRMMIRFSLELFALTTASPGFHKLRQCLHLRQLADASVYAFGLVVAAF